MDGGRHPIGWEAPGDGVEGCDVSGVLEPAPPASVARTSGVVGADLGAVDRGPLLFGLGLRLLRVPVLCCHVRVERVWVVGGHVLKRDSHPQAPG